MPASEPIIWQFSLSTVNAIVWAALLLLALWFGLRLRWGRLVALIAFLTFDLVVFGGFVRLTDSGLGCPDWPGCYGQLLPAQAKPQIEQAIVEQGGTHGPVSHGKAWIEMLHRYLASFIGAMIVVMLVRALLAQRRGAAPGAVAANAGWQWPALLLIVVIAQGLFGKWTVTLKLMPIVVTTHLMGGMLLLALLVWFWTRQRQREGDLRAMAVAVPTATRTLLWVAIAVLAAQIFLGGWVSTNYAVTACADFPGCNGSLTPEVNWGEGFAFARALGRNADGSFLSIDALRAIHWAHRLGALVAAIVIAWTAIALGRAHPALARQAWLIVLALIAQIAVGIGAVLLSLPLALATAHNALAALLLSTLVVAACRVSGVREWQPFTVSTNLRKAR
ncbi:MAG: COX15/CtaA family protein [Burkholderiales bacterium]|nr:COX15/CtaA family protein [Burkholderiales bacterium]